MQVSNRKKLLSEALGRVIKQLHDESNLSARTISYSMNMSKTTLLLAEKGKLDPQISTFCKISEAFYIKPDELMKKVMKELPKNFFNND